MTLDSIKSLIQYVGVPVYHAVNKTVPPEDKYFTYAKDNDGGSTHADNAKHTTVINGTIDLYTRTDNDEAVKTLELIFKSFKIALSYNSFQYEGDTEYYHHEWVFEVIENG